MSFDRSPNTYSVKYLGIVDGSMGILSRKMALKTNQGNSNHSDQETVNIYNNLKQRGGLTSVNRDAGVVNIKQYDNLYPVLRNKYGRHHFSNSISFKRDQHVSNQNLNSEMFMSQAHISKSPMNDYQIKVENNNNSTIKRPRDNLQSPDLLIQQ